MTPIPNSYDPYAEGELRKEFCTIRNRLRRVNPYQLLDYILERMGHQWKLPYVPHNGRDLPWLVFQIIKWSMRYGDPSAKPLRTISRIYTHTYNDVHSLWGRPEVVEKAPTLWMFLKNLSFQEFWLQDEPRHLRLARVGEIVSLNPNLVSWLETLCGIPLQTILEVTFTALAATPKEQTLRQECFRTLSCRWPPESAGRLLSKLSLTPEELRRKFTEYKPLPLIEELYERTPLREHPFLKLPTRSLALATPSPTFVSYYPTLTARALEQLPIILAFRSDPYRASQLFSKCFERYVGQLLTNHGDVESESTLKRRNPTKKIVDYILRSETANILFECKSGRPPHRAGITQSITLLRNYLKNIVEQAILQGLSSANARKHNNKDSFLLIVTFQDLDLGPADLLISDEWRSRIEERAKKENLDTSLLPLTHVSVVSIEALEFLLSKYPDASSLASLLRQSATDRLSPGSAKFSLSMYAEDSRPHPVSLAAADKFFGPLLEFISHDGQLS